MRYLKTFETWEFLVPKDEQYNGLTKEFIDDIFVDISDNGFNLSTYFDKRAISSVDKESGRMIIGAIPYIWLRCNRMNVETPLSNKPTDEIKEYIKSYEFKEIIETANDRLDDFDWYVSSTMVQANQIRIFIHRIEDKKYVV